MTGWQGAVRAREVTSARKYAHKRTHRCEVYGEYLEGRVVWWSECKEWECPHGNSVGMWRWPTWPEAIHAANTHARKYGTTRETT